MSEEETGIEQVSIVVVLQDGVSPDTDQAKHDGPEKDSFESWIEMIPVKPIPVKQNNCCSKTEAT